MFAAQFGEKFGGRTGASGSHICVPLADALDGFFKVLAFSIEIGS